MSPGSTSSLTYILQKRAEMLAAVRAFFAARGTLEVDVCSLVRCPSLDANIDSIEASVADKEAGYLHTSPEFAMKSLLANGAPDIYYLGHVFRKNDLGRLHNPEFTMIEWYRKGISFDASIQETVAIIRLFLGNLPTETLSYRNAFLLYVHADPFADSFDGKAIAQMHGLSLSESSDTWSRDDWLHLLMSHIIEPHLGKDKLTILTDYPPTQAALARVIERQGLLVACRHEIYYRGIELSNGYHELSDSQEQRRRFEEENRLRERSGKDPYPIDEHFLSMLKLGLPDCCGTSIGFDRLLLLQLQLHSIHEVLPCSWEGSFFQHYEVPDATPN